MGINTFPAAQTGYDNFGGYINQGKYVSGSDTNNLVEYTVNANIPAGPYEINMTAGSRNYIQISGLTYNAGAAGAFVTAWATSATSYKIQTTGDWAESIVVVNLTTKSAGIAYGNGFYVVAGGAPSQGSVSTNGANWTTRLDIGGAIPAAAGSENRNLTFTNGYFILNHQGTTNIMISTNATTWTSRLVATSVSPIGPWAYSTAQGLYYNFYLNGGMVVSSDLVTFTTRAVLTGSGTGESSHVYYANPWWVKAGNQGFFVSTNGTTWTTRNIIAGFSPISSAYGNGFFSVAFNGTTTVAVSTDTINWTTAAFPWSSATQINDMVYANGWFVCGGPGLNNSTFSGVFSSTNGLNWVARPTGQSNIVSHKFVWGTTGGWVLMKGQTSAHDNDFRRSLQVYGSWANSMGWNLKAMRNDAVL